MDDMLKSQIKMKPNVLRNNCRKNIDIVCVIPQPLSTK